MNYFSASFSEELFSLLLTKRFKTKKTTPMIIKAITMQLKPTALITLIIGSVISLKVNIGESIIKAISIMGAEA